MPPQTHRIRLTDRRTLAADYFELTLAVLDTPTFAYAPGQFVVIKISDGKEPPAMRAYSIASAPHENEFRLCIKHMHGVTEAGEYFEGRGSSWLHTRQIGETLEILGPNGLPALRDGDTAPLILAGTGTGIAPLKAILEFLTATQNPRQVTLYFGVRYAAELFYQAELAQLAAAHPNLKVQSAVSRPDASWTGRTGRLPALLAADFPNGLPPATAAVVCGGRESTAGICEALTALGLPRTQLHLEAY